MLLVCVLAIYAYHLVKERKSHVDLLLYIYESKYKNLNFIHTSNDISIVATVRVG